MERFVASCFERCAAAAWVAASGAELGNACAEIRVYASASDPPGDRRTSRQGLRCLAELTQSSRCGPPRERALALRRAQRLPRAGCVTNPLPDTRAYGRRLKTRPASQLPAARGACASTGPPPWVKTSARLAATWPWARRVNTDYHQSSLVRSSRAAAGLRLQAPAEEEAYRVATCAGGSASWRRPGPGRDRPFGICRRSAGLRTKARIPACSQNSACHAWCMSMRSYGTTDAALPVWSAAAMRANSLCIYLFRVAGAVGRGRGGTADSRSWRC